MTLLCAHDDWKWKAALADVKPEEEQRLPVAHLISVIQITTSYTASLSTASAPVPFRMETWPRSTQPSRGWALLLSLSHLRTQFVFAPCLPAVRDSSGLGTYRSSVTSIGTFADVILLLSIILLPLCVVLTSTPYTPQQDVFLASQCLPWLPKETKLSIPPP